MQRFLIILMAAGVLTGLVIMLTLARPAGSSVTTPMAVATPSADELPPQIGVMVGLVPTLVTIKRVETLNLVRGLWLDDGQLDRIIDYLGELERMESEVGSYQPLIAANEAEMAHLRALVGELEDTLIAGETIPTGLESEVNRLTLKLMDTFSGVMQMDGRIKAFQQEALDGIVGELNNNQKILIMEYKNCIVPPPGDPNNPEAVGQARGDMAKHITEIRALTDEEFKLAKPHMVDEIWLHLVKHYPDEQQGAETEKRRISGALDAIRAADAKDATVNAEKYGRMIIPYTGHDRPQYHEVDEEMVRNRIYEFFIEFNPVDMLREYRDRR